MLKIDSLTAKYSSRTVLRNISLAVSPGEILALIGPNGAGKTTLIRTVSGVMPLDSGRILLGELDLASLSTSERAKILAVVPQAKQMGGAFTVQQAVMMGRTPYLNWLGREGDADREAVRLALQQTSLETFADRQIAKLSGGEQQRVFLARALAQSTPILLLDEPTNHLDLQHQNNFLSLIKKMAVEKQLAVIMAVHDLNLVSFISNKVALIVDGEIICYGTPKEVIRPDIISAAYQTPVEIVAHPVTGAPIILPHEILDQTN